MNFTLTYVAHVGLKFSGAKVPHCKCFQGTVALPHGQDLNSASDSYSTDGSTFKASIVETWSTDSSAHIPSSLRCQKQSIPSISYLTWHCSGRTADGGWIDWYAQKDGQGATNYP